MAGLAFAFVSIACNQHTATVFVSDSIRRRQLNEWLTGKILNDLLSFNFGTQIIHERTNEGTNEHTHVLSLGTAQSTIYTK